MGNFQNKTKTEAETPDNFKTDLVKKRKLAPRRENAKTMRRCVRPGHACRTGRARRAPPGWAPHMPRGAVPGAASRPPACFGPRRHRAPGAHALHRHGSWGRGRGAAGLASPRPVIRSDSLGDRGSGSGCRAGRAARGGRRCFRRPARAGGPWARGLLSGVLGDGQVYTSV